MAQIVSKPARTMRERSTLYRLLENLSEGREKPVENADDHIVLVKWKDPEKLDATFYDNRFNLFVMDLADHLWVDINYAGATGGGQISIFCLPKDVDAAKEAFQQEREGTLTNTRLYQFMRASELDEIIIFGEKITLPVRGV